MNNEVLHEYWISPAVFDRDVLKGRDKKVFYPLLVNNGYIKKEVESRYLCQRQPHKENRQRFIVIPASIFSGENE